MTKQLRLLVDETMSFGSSDKSIASSPERNEPSPSSNGSSSNGSYKSIFVAVAFINSGCPCSLMIVNCSTSPVLRLVDTSITVLIHNHWATILIRVSVLRLKNCYCLHRACGVLL